MPWCPNCKAEFREGFDTCSDCGIPLVDANPMPDIRVEPEWEVEYLGEPILLTTVWKGVEAQMKEAQLKSEGIPVIIRVNSAGGLLSLYMGTVGDYVHGIKMYVPEKMYEQALDVLAGADIELAEELAQREAYRPDWDEVLEREEPNQKGSLLKRGIAIGLVVVVLAGVLARFWNW